MRNGKKFSPRNRTLINKLVGCKIKSVSYEINVPIESNSINIVFENDIEMNIYAFMRIIKDKKVILSSCDYYLCEEHEEYFASLRNALLGLEVQKIKFNVVGDVIFYLSNNVSFQIFINTSIDDDDFFYLFDNQSENYYELCRYEKKVFIFTGCSKEN